MESLKDINIIENYEMILKRSIIIFGAGGRGRRLYYFARSVGCNIIGFCDNDIKKNGTNIDVIPVFCLDSLNDFINEETIIIVSSVWYKEIVDELIKIVPVEVIFTEFSFRLSIEMNRFKLDFPKSGSVKFFLENMLLRELRLYHYENEIMALKAYLDMEMNHVLVYQAGKVGSTTLADSINYTGKLKASHCHYLSTTVVFNGDENHLNYCNYALKHFKGKIIIPIREPIARDISQYFQLLEARRAVLLTQYKTQSLSDGFYKLFCRGAEQKTSEASCFTFQDYLNRGGFVKGTQFDWFDVEFKENFGIDIFDCPFDKEKGYSIISNKDIKIFILQMEKMNALEKEIGDFLELPEFKIVRSNSNRQKEYQYLYKNFIESLILPKDYFEKYYKNNKYYQHFYSDKAILENKEKWISHVKEI